MQKLLLKIYSLDEQGLDYNKTVGICAKCEHPVTKKEEDLLNEFWRSFCENPPADIFLDILIDCELLTPDQFNKFHEPLLCLACLKKSIHKENN